MTECKGPSSNDGSIQTRYSFYNAESTDESVFLFGKTKTNKKDSKEEQSQSNLHDNQDAHDISNIPEHDDQQEYQQDNQLEQQHQQQQQQQQQQHESNNYNTTTIQEGNNNDSSEKEDIWHNLQETEEMTTTHTRHQEDGEQEAHSSTNASNSNFIDSIIATVNNITGNRTSTSSNSTSSQAKQHLKLESFSLEPSTGNQFEHAFNPFANDDTDDDHLKKQHTKSHGSNDNNSNPAPSSSEVSPYEQALKEAIYQLRLRSQKRALLLKPNTANSSSSSTSYNNLPCVSEEFSQYDKYNVHPSAIHYQNESSLSSNIPELGSTSESGSSSTGNHHHNHNLSLPLQPTCTSSANNIVMNATIFDDRLLSPAADVRKAVEFSAAEMFRLHGYGSESSINNKSDDDDVGVDRSCDGDRTTTHLLHLANPIHSHSITHGSESPMHTSNNSNEHENNRNNIEEKRPFSVVPSSPAPKNLHVFNKSYNVNNNINGSQPEQRDSILELQRRLKQEEYIEKSIEQVLLAIMQSATALSKNKNSNMNQSSSGRGDDTTTALLESVFTSLSRESSLFYHKVKDRDAPVEHEDVTSSSTVDVLLKEPDNSDFIDNTLTTPQAPSDSNNNNDTSLEKIEECSESCDTSQQKNNTSIHPYTVEADGTLEVEAVERGIRPSSAEETKNEDVGEEREEEQQQGEELNEEEGEEYFKEEHVLGPLNKVSGGTTGVVLDDDTDQEEELNEEEEEEVTATISVPTKPTKPTLKIIESITAAVRNNSKAGGMMSKLTKDSKNRGRDVDDFNLPRKQSLAQIKELYAHMLPYVSNKNCRKSPTYSTWFTDKLSGTFNKLPPYHPWDDDDPDELGYIVHTFTRLQLQMLEQDYEELIEKVDKKYEVAVKRGMVRIAPQRKKSDLNTRRKLSTGKSRQNASDHITKKSDLNRVGTGKRKLVNDRLATNPNFPKVKPAGTGDVGELELYHLPIIYKAHQTGFEPTKDLVLQPDTVFAGNYYVQGELGSAAFSTAYRCVDLNSGKKSDDGETYYDEVCLKVIKNTKDFFDQSLDEIKILELLRQTNQCHEHNILEMKTFFYHKEHLIIVTELLRQNLFEFGKYITENGEPTYFTTSRLCYICRQCLVALSFVHNLGLVHSDIKPENILLASYSRARVKVIDFGSSCYLTDRQSSYIQSRSYRAPEVILGLPYSGKIDIWSLGCVIAEMFTGQVTFQNDSVVTMLSRIEAICGAFPRHMIENGRQSGQFFTPTGLLYEKADIDDESEGRTQTFDYDDDDSSDGDNELFHVFQPKITNIASRLGFDPNLLENKRSTWEEEEKALFVDFVTKLLTIDPDKRPTAEEALAHPWILSGYNLTEEDLKYPPEE